MIDALRTLAAMAFFGWLFIAIPFLIVTEAADSIRRYRYNRSVRRDKTSAG